MLQLTSQNWPCPCHSDKENCLRTDITSKIKLHFYLVTNKEFYRWHSFLLFNSFKWLEKVYFLFTGQKIDGILTDSHNRICEFVTQKPWLKRWCLAVNNFLISTKCCNDGIHISKSSIGFRIFILLQMTFQVIKYAKNNTARNLLSMPSRAV